MSVKVRVLAAIGALGLLAGCGTATAATASPASPKTKFASAVNALLDGQALTVTVRPDVSAATLAKLVPAAKLARAKRFVDTSLTFSELAPKGTLAQLAKTGAAPEIALTLDVAGTDVLRVIGNAHDIYLRVNFAGLHPLAAGRRGWYQALPPALAGQGFIKQALAGGWLAIPVAQLRALAGTSPMGSEQALAAALKKDVTVTGTKGAYTLSANARTLGQDLMNSLGSAGSVFASRLGGPSGLPNQKVTVAATSANGVLSSLRVDLGQFASPGERAKLGSAPPPALVVGFSQGATGTFTAPRSSTTVNLSQLAPLLLGSAGSGSPAGSAAA